MRRNQTWDIVPWLRTALPLVMLTLVVLIWSSNNIATKLVLRETTPALLTMVRFTLTTLLFYLPAFFFIRKMGQPMSRAVVCWRRVGSGAMAARDTPMRPRRVPTPVRSTRATPCPRVTRVPE